jgi:hypothetical protein
LGTFPVAALSRLTARFACDALVTDGPAELFLQTQRQADARKMAVNATTSPLATIKLGAANVAPQLEYVLDYVSNASAWSILATLLAIAVVYDQCMLATSARFSQPIPRRRTPELTCPSQSGTS